MSYPAVHRRHQRKNKSYSQELSSIFLSHYIMQQIFLERMYNNYSNISINSICKKSTACQCTISTTLSFCAVLRQRTYNCIFKCANTFLRHRKSTTRTKNYFHCPCSSSRNKREYVKPWTDISSVTKRRIIEGGR